MPLAWPSSLRLALPGLCAVCRRWTRAALCGDCIARFGQPVPRCAQCAIRVPPGVARCGACLKQPAAPVQQARVAVDYGFPWDGLIAGFKFHDRLELAGALAALLDTAIADAPAPDLLLPVPLSPERLRERGYNQAWELARRVARRRGLAARPAALMRIKHTAHQLGLNEAQRAANLRGAFLVEPREIDAVRGRRIALVDDVMTSGATAAEAARCLLAAGAREVHLWALARTPAPG